MAKNVPKNIKNLKIADVVSKSTGKGWAYSKTVKDHFFHPRNLLLKDPKPGEFDAEGQIGAPQCVLGSTNIHTNPETKPISETLIGNEVLSHNGRYNLVTKIFSSRYKDPVIELKNQLGNIVITPDHLVYAMKVERPPSFYQRTFNKKKAIVGWYHAFELKKGDVCLYPLLKIIREKKYLETEIERKKYDFNSQSIPSKISITKELLRFFGYFVAEGSTREGKELRGGVVQLAFNGNELEYARDVQRLSRKVFRLKAIIKKRPNCLVVLIYNIHLAKLLKGLFGKFAQNKKLPEFLLYLPQDLQKSFICGIWRGDGYFNWKKRWPRAGYSTISCQLAQQLKLILLRQGIAFSLYKEKAKILKGVRHKIAYRIHVGEIESLKKLAQILRIPFQKTAQKILTWFDQNYLYLPIKKVKKSKYNGKLFNLEIQRAHTFASEAFLLHNCGDVMRMWIKIHPKTEKIKKLKWRTFGCSSAIATTSIFSVMVTEGGGMKIDEALKIRPQDIMKKLGGLPARKVHCSVLADKAFRKTINNYFRKTGQHQRIIVEGARVIDEELNITDKDIEEAVLEGARTIEDLQKRLKVGIGNPEAIPEIEQLLRFYREKYYGP